MLQKIKNNIFPHLESLFHLSHNLLRVEEIFIAIYEGNVMNAQNSLKPHEDGSEFSFILALNDNYEGGGTHFVKQNKSIHLNTGDLLIFCGQTKHAGLPVIQGTRYIMPGFIYYGKCSQQDN